MSLRELILADVRQSARRAHRCYRIGEVREARQLAGRVTTLLAGLREKYDTDHPFHQMVREAARLRLPEAYVADVFVHDRLKLEAMSAEGGTLRFVWVLHACGSHLLDARASQSPSHLAAPFLRRTDGYHVYLFEDGHLTEYASHAGRTTGLLHHFPARGLPRRAERGRALRAPLDGTPR